jgi:hypothetical protein
MMGDDDAVVVDVATVAFIVPTMGEDVVVIHNAAVVDDRRCNDRRDKKDDDDDDEENVMVGGNNDQTGWYEHCVHSSNSITFLPMNTRLYAFILQYMLYLPNRYVSIRTIEVE